MSRLKMSLSAVTVLLFLIGCAGRGSLPLPTPSIAQPTPVSTPTLAPTPTTATPIRVSFAGEAAANRFPEEGVLIFHFLPAVDPALAAQPVVIEPFVELLFSWENDNHTLVATPQRPLQAGTVYTVSLDRALLTGGNEPPSWIITPAAGARVLRRSPRSEIISETRPEIALVFDREMALSSVENALEVDPPLSFDLSQEGAEIRLIPRELLQPGTTYRFTLGTGAAGLGGGAPLTQPYSWQFRLSEVVSRIVGPTDEL